MKTPEELVGAAAKQIKRDLMVFWVALWVVLMLGLYLTR
jgi:hypothetical protein